MTDINDLATDPLLPRRTKRRYAHELFPHAADDELRPLAVDVPYWYARAKGLSLQDTSWSSPEGLASAGERVTQFIDTMRIALLADAAYQGLSGQELWDWVEHRVTDDMEVAWERAYEYIDDDVIESIKPYSCGPEPEVHWHYEPRNAHGARFMHRAAGRESECIECTEPIIKEA
jgi:hypothetical protein